MSEATGIVGADWSVEPEITDDMVRSSLPPQVWFKRYEQQAPKREEFNRVSEGRLPVKPSGGMWTSTFALQESEHLSDWDRWCSHNGYLAGSDAYVLEVQNSTKIIEINTLNELKRLVQVYYNEAYYDGISSSAIRDYPIDFVGLASDGFDAVRLTRQGLSETHLPGRDEPNLYGWDSESTVWLDWSFSRVVAHLGSVD